MKKSIVQTKNLRDELKLIMENEIANLPILLSGLEPQVRVNLIIKLMPFIFPKIETVSPSFGEGIDFGFGFD